MNAQHENKAPRSWQMKLHEVIYESEKPEGKAFDIALLACILISILVVVLDSVEQLHQSYGGLFSALEWFFTIVFTIEYILRLICIRKPYKYIFSGFGIIDLLAIIPSYLSIIFAGAQSLLVFRALRLLRVFRIFRLVHFLSEMRFLSVALMNSLRKISIFILFVLTVVTILGSVIYLVEGPEHGFTSIPSIHLLGHRYHHNGRVWRCGAGNASRQIHRQLHHAAGLWHHRRAYGHRYYWKWPLQ